MKKNIDPEPDLKQKAKDEIYDLLTTPFVRMCCSVNPGYREWLLWKFFELAPTAERERTYPSDFAEEAMTDFNMVLKFVEKMELIIGKLALEKIFKEIIPALKCATYNEVYKRKDITVTLFKEIRKIIANREPESKKAYDAMSLTGFIMVQCEIIDLKSDNPIYSLINELLNGCEKKKTSLNLMRELRDLISPYVNTTKKLKEDIPWKIAMENRKRWENQSEETEREEQEINWGKLPIYVNNPSPIFKI